MKESSRPFGVEPVPSRLVLTPDAEGYVCAGPVAACPEGRSIAIAVANFRIAVFHRTTGWFAIRDACPHAEYPLSKGMIEDDIVTCASHGWRFRLKTGECLRGAPDLCIRTFPVEIRTGQMWVRVRA